MKYTLALVALYSHCGFFSVFLSGAHLAGTPLTTSKEEQSWLSFSAGSFSVPLGPRVAHFPSRLRFLTCSRSWDEKDVTERGL